MGEAIGIIIFSAFMLGLVGLLVGNLFVALYRERRTRKAGREPHGGAAEE